MKIRQENIKKISESRGSFFELVKEHNRDDLLIDPSFYLYQKIIEKHREIGQIEQLVKDKKFLELVYMTLISWNMNQRGAIMVPFKEFLDSVLLNHKILKKLSQYRIEKLSIKDMDIVLAQIKILFKKLTVMGTKSKIVGVSKTLHFLLPNLIMPIDRTYTMQVMYKSNAYLTNEKEINQFNQIFKEFYKIAIKLKLSDKDLEINNWNTSVPKLIDNAIIEFKKIIDPNKKEKSD